MKNLAMAANALEQLYFSKKKPNFLKFLLRTQIHAYLKNCTDNV